MNPNDTDGHQVGNGLGTEQPNTFAPNTGAIPNTVTSEAFSALQQNTFTPNTGDAFNAPQAPIISSSPDPEDKKENSITRAFGGRSRASKIAAQAPVQPSRLRQNAPDFFQQSMQQQDIVLNNEVEQKAKGKKGLLIGGVIGGIVLVGIVIAAVLMSAFGAGNKEEGSIAASVIDAFHKYGNYIMLGEDKTDNLSAISNIYDYKISKVANSEANDYLEEAYNLYINFYEELKAQQPSPDNKLISIAESYKENIALVKFAYSDKLSEERLCTLYFENGLEGALSFIDSYYGNTNDISYDYITSLISYQKEILKNIDIAVKRGCITQTKYDQACADIVWSEQASAANNEQDKLQARISDFEANAINKVKTEIKTLNDELEK